MRQQFPFFFFAEKHGFNIKGRNPIWVWSEKSIMSADLNVLTFKTIFSSRESARQC